MPDLLAYLGLAASAFAAATIFPAQSEAVFAGLLLAGHPAWLLLAVAGTANTAGAVVNWFIGRGIGRLRAATGRGPGDAAMRRAEDWYRRWGRWTLLASWVPFVGDPLTVVAGVLREPLAVFLALVATAKFGRYAVLAAITQGFL